MLDQSATRLHQPLLQARQRPLPIRCASSKRRHRLRAPNLPLLPGGFRLAVAFRVELLLAPGNCSDLALAILALRQQVAVLNRKRPRPKLNSFDLLLWTTLRRVGAAGRRFYSS